MHLNVSGNSTRLGFVIQKAIDTLFRISVSVLPLIFLFQLKQQLVKVFKNGSSKTCVRQPLKNSK